jgi:hypothetical protein
MSSNIWDFTIDTYHARIVKKIKDFQELICWIRGYAEDLNIDAGVLADTGQQLKALRNEYLLESSAVLRVYFSETDIKPDFGKYYDSIEPLDLPGKFTDIETRIRNYLNKTGITELAYIQQLDAISKPIIRVVGKRKEFDVCMCGCKIGPGTAMCEECRKMNTVADSDPEESSEIAGTRSRNNQMKQFDKWLCFIQAKEMPNFPEKFLANFKQEIDNRGLSKKHLTIKQVRSILSTLKKTTEYNKYAAGLIYKMSEIAPPQLTVPEENEFRAKFELILETYKRVDSNNLKKVKNYPYFIYKIGQQLLPQWKKTGLLNYIYLQSPSTLKDNDILYRKIVECVECPGDLKFFETKH